MNRLFFILLGVLMLAGCDVPAGSVTAPVQTDGAFAVAAGAALPYRTWMPNGRPNAVVLALHGMNDSRDAWEYPAPDLAAAGVAVFAPDWPGFGATDGRGFWPGTDRLVADMRAMVHQLHLRYPGLPLFVLAESMGGAVAMVAATEPGAEAVDGYILIAPAVWTRREMNVFMRVLLWTANRTVPSMAFSGRGVVKVTASDNRQALVRLSQDPLTIRATRVRAIAGLVDLMDRAAAAAPGFQVPSLILYGGRDQLVPAKATAAMWQALPAGPVRAFYPSGYHLLLRDNDRAERIGDILAWMRNPRAPFPSGADRAAAGWLEQQR